MSGHKILMEARRRCDVCILLGTEPAAFVEADNLRKYVSVVMVPELARNAPLKAQMDAEPDGPLWDDAGLLESYDIHRDMLAEHERIKAYLSKMEQP